MYQRFHAQLAVRASGSAAFLLQEEPRIEAHVNRRLGALEMLEREAGTVEENCGQEGVADEEGV